MRLNNKGFALTSMIYMLLVLFLMVMLLLLSNLAQRKVLLDKLRYDVKNKLEQGVSVNTQDLAYQNETTGIYYETLALSLFKANSGDVIKVLRNVTEVSGAINSAGVSNNPVVLDLNGKTISFNVNENGVSAISNTGMLEVMDSVGDGSITSFTIAGSDSIVSNSDSGIFTLTSGMISVVSPSSANAINSTGGSINIIGGSVSSALGIGIYSTSGNILIGTSGGVPSQTVPSITGKNYGISNPSGSINYYDGIIVGNNGSGSSISGTVSTQSGYSVSRSVSGGVETAKLQ